MVKKYILGLLLIIFGTINLGVTEKYKPVASFEISNVTKDYSKLTPYIPLFQSYVDSIPTVDNFGRVRNGIIAQGIIDVLNTDPSGVKLTELELAYIRSIVGGLYLAGSWQKMKALYGFVGGNAWKHKWNWKDMRDLNSAYRLLFPNGATHDSNGVLFNGSTQYANTFLNPMLAFSNAKNISIGAYINGGTRVGGTPGTNTISANGNGGTSTIQTHQTTFTQRTTLSSLRVQGEQDINNGSIPVVINASNGYLLGTNDSGILKLFFRGVKIGQRALVSSENAAAVPLYLGATNNNNSSVGSPQNIRLAAVIISDSSTEQECILQSKNITFSQAILNRQ